MVSESLEWSLVLSVFGVPVPVLLPVLPVLVPALPLEGPYVLDELALLVLVSGNA
jgi:hypothetical protein